MACFLMSCSEDNQICEECSENLLISTFENQHLFLQDHNNGRLTIQNDSSGEILYPSICPGAESVFEESGVKYGSFEGQIFESCDTTELSYINLTNYSKISGCNQPMDSVTNEAFSLQGQWKFSYVKEAEQKIEVPCELESYVLSLSDSSLGLFQCGFDLLVDSDSLHFGNGVCIASIDYRMETVDSKRFSDHVQKVLFFHSVHYSIRQNFLILTSREGNQLVLFKEE